MQRFGPAFWVGLGTLVVLALIGGAAQGAGAALLMVGLFAGATALWHVIVGRSWVSPLIPVGRGKAAIGIPVAFGVVLAGAAISPAQPTTAVPAVDSATVAETPSTTRPTQSPTPPSTPTATSTPAPSRTPAPSAFTVRPGTDTAVAELATLAVKGRAPKTGYSRAQFGQAWADVDHNGCDTRNDILQRDLVGETFKAGTKDCVVLTGMLHDPYTAKDIAFTRGQSTSNEIQIDHVVALSDAWQTGAQQISATDRESLANDPLNLLAVDGPTNEQKSDGDAATWLPANKAFRCQYVARQIAVKHNYRLWVTQAEHDAMSNVLSGCRNQTVPYAAAPDVTWASKAITTPVAPTSKVTSTAAAPTSRSTATQVAPTHRATTRKAAPTRKATSKAQSQGTVHGGSFCSSQGATGVTSAGTTVTCKVAKGGKLRWKK